MTTEQPTVAEDSSDSLPGARLRAARLNANLSLADVARLTRISVSKLEALERSDYKTIGSSTYVSGYIRAYARALRMPADELVEAYNRSQGEGFGVPVSPPVITAPIKRMNPVFLTIGALLCLWLVGVWLLSDKHSVDLEERPRYSNQNSLDVSTLDEQESALTAEPPAGDSSSNALEAETSPLTVPQASVAEPSTSVSDEQAATTPAAEPRTTPAEEPAPETDTAPAVGIPEEPVKVDTLSASFIDECWIQVTDATGATLVAQVAGPGDNLHLSGVAPFEMVLGNARAADVLFNGEPVATVPSGGRRTLRLKIGS